MAATALSIQYSNTGGKSEVTILPLLTCLQQGKLSKMSLWEISPYFIAYNPATHRSAADKEEQLISTTLFLLQNKMMVPLNQGRGQWLSGGQLTSVCLCKWLSRTN